MRIVVTGGRAYGNKEQVLVTLDAHAPTEIAHGGARGADQLADQWAKARHVPCTVYAADWKVQGVSAGVLRNLRMLDEFKPDMVVAFPGGRGTAHCIEAAQHRDIMVQQVEHTW